MGYNCSKKTIFLTTSLVHSHSLCEECRWSNWEIVDDIWLHAISLSISCASLFANIPGDLIRKKYHCLQGYCANKMARERPLICGTPFQPFLSQPIFFPSHPSLSLFTATFFHTLPWLGRYQVSSQIYESWVDGGVWNQCFIMLKLNTGQMKRLKAIPKYCS